MKGVKHIHVAVVVCTVVSVVIIWAAVFQVEAGWGEMRLTVFDVGQGDAVFVETPSGKQMLVDGGPDGSVLSRLGSAMPFWDRSIDILVISHPHSDHLTGAIEVLKRYDVGLVVESGVEYSTAEYEEWQRVVEASGAPIHIARAGEVIEFGDGVRFEIFLPAHAFVGASLKNVHDAMVVGRLVFASSSALLMGDAEASEEYQMMYAAEDLFTDILKVGHHGSKTSTSEPFLRAVSPDIAIISSGRKNRYGHPNQGVLDRLGMFDVSLFRTDSDGSITFTTGGHEWIQEK